MARKTISESILGSNWMDYLTEFNCIKCAHDLCNFFSKTENRSDGQKGIKE